MNPRTPKFFNNGIEVKHISEKKGRGVFATRTIKKGEVFEIAPCLIVPHDESELVNDTFLGFYTYSPPGPTKDEDEETYDECSIIALGYGSLYNTNKNPNADYAVYYNHAKYFALRTIKKGEEILINYGWDESYTKDFE